MRAVYSTCKYFLVRAVYLANEGSREATILGAKAKGA